MEAKKEVPLIGKLAVKYEFITKDQLKRSLRICEDSARDGKKVSLPEVFVRTKLIVPAEMKRLHQLLADYKKRILTKKPETHKEPAITVSEDGLTAFFTLPEGFSGEITREDVLEMINRSGIVNGLVNESEITDYIDIPEAYGQPLIIARGTPGFEGKASFVEYFFDNNFYRDRFPAKSRKKEPERVTEGEILMKKHPMIPPREGMLVTGRQINAGEFEEKALRAGYGTAFMENDMKIVAANNGNPFLSLEGRAFVYEQINISGDYGIVSGPVENDSNLVVSGILTGEYPVRGGYIKAREIRGADIDILGSVDVNIGITGSVIRCQGDVYARYIRGSVIETCGNVITDKEIMDSEIIAGGVCCVRNSKIVGSKVSAKKRIEAAGIGSKKSIPCEITVGHDHAIDKIVSRIDYQLEKNLEKIKNIAIKIEELRTTQVEFNRQIKEQLDFHAQLKRAVNSTEKTLASLSASEDKEKLKKAKGTLSELRKKSEKTVIIIKELSEELPEMKRELELLPEKIKLMERENDELSLDRDGLLKWENPVAEPPAIVIRGTIEAGTLLSCKNAFEKISRAISGVRVSEMSENASEGEELLWKLSFSKFQQPQDS